MINHKRSDENSVSIIGAGNSGCAMAVDLAHRGFNVCIYAHSDHSKKLDSIRQRGCLISDGEIRGEFKMELLTNDIQEAMLFSKYQIVSLPSFAQDFVFSLMNPYLSDDHVIIGLNGNFLI